MLILKHGGHILDDNAPGAEETTKKMDDVVLAKNALRKGEPRPTETPFDYLLSELANDPANHLPADDPAKVVADLSLSRHSPLACTCPRRQTVSTFGTQGR